MKIADIADCKTGYTLRGKAPSGDAEQGFYLLQLRDVEPMKQAINGSAQRIGGVPVNDKEVLDAGDLLLSSKGNFPIAYTYDGQYDRAVASSSFIVIRPDREKVKPEYLAWALNCDKAQKALAILAGASTARNIKVQDIRDFKIDLPARSVQEAIAKLGQLQKRERSILTKLAKLRSQQVEAEISKLLNQTKTQ